MLDNKEFNQIENDLARIDDKREEIIKKSRDVLKLSKQAIYDIHRNDLNYSKKKIETARAEILRLKKEISKTEGLEAIGALNAATEEWCEAKCYYDFIKNKKIPTKKALSISTDSYLGGLSDLTGELSRKAVVLATEGNVDEVIKIRDLVDEIFGQFLKFNFRNSELRKKSDSIKWNLKKIEEVLYDLKKR